MSSPFDHDALVRIARSDPALAENVAILEAHLALCRATSPPEATHALDLEALRRPSVTFWSARFGDATVGCGALKELDPSHGEVKSMHTLASVRRRGVARRIVETIVEEAERRGYTRLSLETGTTEVFAPARALYLALGFEPCGPFAGYAAHPHSAFLTLALG